MIIQRMALRLDFSIFSMHISAYVLVFGRVLSEAPPRFDVVKSVSCGYSNAINHSLVITINRSYI